MKHPLTLIIALPLVETVLGGKPLITAPTPRLNAADGKRGAPT